MHLKQITLLSSGYPTEKMYPFNLPVLRNTDGVHFETPVTFFAGENGTGKSTLMEAIASRAGIHIWRDEDRARGRANPYEKLLGQYIEIEWTAGKVPGAYFGADTFRYFTESLEGWAACDPGILGYFGGKSLVTQSHGQSMMAYFESRYRLAGLYLMDEPETALSPRNQVKLAKLLMKMGAAGHAQFIVATHSPILLACPGARILGFDSAAVTPMDYRETEHYRLYRDFMADPDRYLGK